MAREEFHQEDPLQFKSHNGIFEIPLKPQEKGTLQITKYQQHQGKCGHTFSNPWTSPAALFSKKLQ